MRAEQAQEKSKGTEWPDFRLASSSSAPNDQAHPPGRRHTRRLQKPVLQSPSDAAPCSLGCYFASFGRPGQTLLGLMIPVMSCIITHAPVISAPEFSITTIVIRSDGR